MVPGIPESLRTSLIPAVYLVLIEDGRILMARRINTGYGDGMYGLVAGHLEAGEMLTAALIREAREEAGIVLDAAELTLAHTLHRPAHGRLDFFFTARRWQGSVEIREPDKCDDLSWFPVQQLPETTLPYIRRAIEDIKNGIGFSEAD
jgi:ADP-ribose pyrophosphatase YjhB (NUDIX family)